MTSRSPFCPLFNRDSGHSREGRKEGSKQVRGHVIFAPQRQSATGRQFRDIFATLHFKLSWWEGFPSRDSISYPLFAVPPCFRPLSALSIHKGRQDLSGMTINNSGGERDILLFGPRVIKRIPRRHCRRRGSFFRSNGFTPCGSEPLRFSTEFRGRCDVAGDQETGRRDARRKNAHHLFSLHIPPSSLLPRLSLSSS